MAFTVYRLSLFDTGIAVWMRREQWQPCVAFFSLNRCLRSKIFPSSEWEQVVEGEKLDWWRLAQVRLS